MLEQFRGRNVDSISGERKLSWHVASGWQDGEGLTQRSVPSSLNDEAKRRELARPVANERPITKTLRLPVKFVLRP